MPFAIERLGPYPPDYTTPIIWTVLLASPVLLLLLGHYLLQVRRDARVRYRARGLEQTWRSTLPLGFLHRIKGVLDGREVRVQSDRIEVVQGTGVAQPFYLDRAALRAMIDDDRCGPEVAGHAAALLALGVRRLIVRSQRVVARGGAARAVELVPHALALVATPLRVRALGEVPRGCPYCRQPLAAPTDEAAVRCPACEVQHHTECWQEHGGCALLGCARAPAQGRPRPAKT